MLSGHAVVGALRFLVAIVCGPSMAGPVLSQVSEPVLIRARYLRLDSTLVRQRSARLTIVVRALEEPERLLDGVAIGLVDSPDSVLVTSKMPFVPSGLTSVVISPGSTRYVAVRRLGYGAALIRVQLQAGCHARLEIYLPMALSCLEGCPVDDVRATVTECGGGA